MGGPSKDQPALVIVHMRTHAALTWGTYPMPRTASSLTWEGGGVVCEAGLRFLRPVLPLARFYPLVFAGIWQILASVSGPRIHLPLSPSSCSLVCMEGGLSLDFPGSGLLGAVGYASLDGGCSICGVCMHDCEHARALARSTVLGKRGPPSSLVFCLSIHSVGHSDWAEPVSARSPTAVSLFIFDPNETVPLPLGSFFGEPCLSFFFCDCDREDRKDTSPKSKRVWIPLWA